MSILKKAMIILLSILLLLTLAAVIIFQQKSFGKNPSGIRLERIKHSPNYKNGSFHNISETPMMSDDGSYWKLLKEYFSKKQNTEPSANLPSIKTDLKAAPSQEPSIVWFGHSSYFIQINGLNILVDPVLSERTSPVQYAGSKNYPGTRIYSVDDFPSIDLLIISHDHYDHLDFETITKLGPKINKVITPLGVGEHLEYWGIPQNKISEFDWWEETSITDAIKLAITPARHFSGRGIFNRNQTLWASFALITPTHRLFLGGDSGYDTHFKEIGNKYGPFDIALLESGQYNEMWPYIHMLPEETVQANIDLNSKVLFPVHWGKFTLALHAWNEPVERVLKYAEKTEVKVTTPMIGEKVIINKNYPAKLWWTLDVPVKIKRGRVE
jgi:L-ascorbate metabolism protein UlaG (beta-lactamase superfamily)